MRPLGSRQQKWLEIIRLAGGRVTFMPGLHAYAFVPGALVEGRANPTIPWSVLDGLERRGLLVAHYEVVAGYRQPTHWTLGSNI